MPVFSAETNVRRSTELEGLAKRHGGLRQALSEPRVNGTRYHILEDDLGDACFFKPLMSDGLIVGVVNPRHRFYKTVYKPIMDSKDAQSPGLANALQLMMLAAARAEATFSECRDIETLERFRHEWEPSHGCTVGGEIAMEWERITSEPITLPFQAEFGQSVHFRLGDGLGIQPG